MALKSTINDAMERLTTIKVLIVMDGSPGDIAPASFGPGDTGDGYFGLSEFLRTLAGGLDEAAPAPSITKFTVTKAHRGTDPGDFSDPNLAPFKPDFEQFQFDQHDLSAYDEIWLFGVAGASDVGTTQNLTDSELQKIAAFMDGGGGVFATGDHEDHGLQMCGRVPRVRTMRKWYFDESGLGQPDPDGAPSAPSALGADRIDTLQLSRGQELITDPPSVLFDNQSDDNPQTISPQFFSGTMPHPVLSVQVFSPAVRNFPLVRPITVLPDHMHEGEVLDTPWTTDATLIFNGQSFVEYPLDAPGKQLLPRLVAQGQVWAHETDPSEMIHQSDPNSICNPRTFGIIGAYDGHYVNRGRVVVDSTWHHFFDINLIGDPLAPPPKNQGFKATPEGRLALSDIKRYYLNTAIWLAPAATHIAGFQGYVLFCRYSYPLNEILKSRRRSSPPPAVLEIGAVALNMLRRFTNDNLLYSSLLAHLRLKWRQRQLTLPLPDPWCSVPTAGAASPVSPTLLLQAALGGAVIRLARELTNVSTHDPQSLADAVRRIVPPGIDEGLQAVAADLVEECKQTNALAEALRS